MTTTAPITRRTHGHGAVPSVIGDGWFGLWLLLRAGKTRATDPVVAR